MLLLASVATQTSVRAAESSFTLFEHGATPAAVEAPGVAAEASRDSRKGRSNREAATSLREMIYASTVRAAELRYRLPEGLLRALIWTESRFDPMAISPAGAAGLTQLMPGTARDLGVRNRHDPVASIDGGACYLRLMLDRFGAIHLALAAYNAGPKAVLRVGGIPRNGQTPGYVRTVFERWRAVPRP